ncbi:MAG: TIGR04211 family SH3 domain-containing protein [Deltaproteobacteria bacterium]|nr:TIGR04211 family SH3 domain-containing protein [Deltaproteobacteria bacterium]MBW2018567.1 TIGR04211 family SH3 domain-containing protein [Deltaproteobacteria bacterium]MBW2073302.1 TIGR04211 family SH3 domain-containing protein [Deltaproteobacteria bacterium]
MGQTSWAAKAYVTDTFRISLRRGPSIENKILKFLPSGLPVKVLESQGGWSRVHVLENEQGILEGWVLSRYLITRLPWEEQAKSLKQENAQLKEKIVRIEKWGEAVRQELGLTRELKENYEVTLKAIQTLTKENERLRSSRRSKWFAMGALVLFFGLMIGLVLGKPQRRLKSSYYL